MDDKLFDTLMNPVRNPRRPNINLDQRPMVDMGDGQYATVRSLTVGEPGNFTNIPSVHPGGYVMSDDESYDRWRQTGQHLGSMFPTVEDAVSAAKALSARQGRFYGRK